VKQHASDSPASPDRTRARATGRKPHRATKQKPETWTHRFIAVMAENFGDPTAAARAVGISRQAAFERRASDADFDAAWTRIADGHTDQLENVMMKRAILGDQKPVIRKGETVAGPDGKPLMEATFDTCLQWNLLRCRRAATYNRAPGDGEGGAGQSARENAAKLREALAGMGETVPAAPEGDGLAGAGAGP
jgi:hypothetical protein